MLKNHTLLDALGSQHALSALTPTSGGLRVGLKANFTQFCHFFPTKSGQEPDLGGLGGRRYFPFLKKCLSNNELEAVIYYSNNSDSINIRANNDYIFNLICSHNYTDIAQWFCTLEDNYRIIIKNNNIIKYWVKDEIYGRIPLRAAKVPPINSDCYICLENKKLHSF